MHRGLPRVAALDLLSCLVMVFAILALIAQPKAKPPTIRTPGVVAVIITWPDGSPNDIDLWVQDPKNDLVFYAQRDAGRMFLEHDDQGTRVSGTVDHNERVVVREVEPGEYTANIHFYQGYGRTPVKIELWRTTGTSAPAVSRTIVLTHQGEEETAFRFTLTAAGNITNVNSLQKRFVS